MKVRREARTLKGGALCSLRRAVTAFHSCGDDGRVTCVLLHCPPVARIGMRSTCPALYEMSDYFSLRGSIIAMSRRTIAVSAALLIISGNVARADSCPPPTIVKTLVERRYSAHGPRHFGLLMLMTTTARRCSRR